MAVGPQYNCNHCLRHLTLLRFQNCPARYLPNERIQIYAETSKVFSIFYCDLYYYLDPLREPAIQFQFFNLPSLVSALHIIWQQELLTIRKDLLPLDRPYWPQYFPIPLTPACRFICTVMQKRTPTASVPCDFTSPETNISFRQYFDSQTMQNKILINMTFCFMKCMY